MRADLSLQQAPPFSVPVRFLVSAPFFALLAAIVMLLNGPEMIHQRWTAELLAVTHFLTLGFLSMSMIGAMMQLMPVLMGTLMPHAILVSSVLHSLLVFGCLCLGFAWLLQIKILFLLAAVLLGLCFFPFILITAKLLLQSTNTSVTRNMMLLSILALTGTICIGLYLALGYGLSSIPLLRQLTNLHLSWGLLGWLMLLLMAVAYQVIPMFQITDEYPQWHQRWSGWIIFLCLLGLGASELLITKPLPHLLPLILSACLLIFAIISLRLLQKRRRKLPDLTLKFWQLAMTNLLLAVISQQTASLSNWPVPALLPAVLMVHGFAMTAINGMMYKIIPFIIWLHLNTRNKALRNQGAREAQIKVPHMRNIISPTAVQWQFRCHLLALLLLTLATQWPMWWFYSAALTLAVSQALLLFNLLNAVRFYRIKSAQFIIVSPAS